jgi:hypothetical protein
VTINSHVINDTVLFEHDDKIMIERPLESNTKSNYNIENKFCNNQNKENNINTKNLEKSETTFKNGKNSSSKKSKINLFNKLNENIETY